MLRDVGVRSKLFGVLAIPTILLILASSWLVGGQVSAARDAGRVAALTDVAVQVNRVTHSLQLERSTTLEWVQDPSAGNHSTMLGQRRFTDLQLGVLRDEFASSPLDKMSDAIRTAAAQSVAAHAELPKARSSIEHNRYFAAESDSFYGRIIGTDLQLPSILASSSVPNLARNLQAYSALSNAIEYASHERDLVEIAQLRGVLDQTGFERASALVFQQRDAMSDFQRFASPAMFNALERGLTKGDNAQLDKSRRALPLLVQHVAEPDLGVAAEWVRASNGRINTMVATEAGLVTDIATSASAEQNAQEHKALLFGTTAAFGLVAALLLAYLLAQGITRPLKRLTIAAGEIGDELPRMVERMTTPGEGPGVAVEPIAVESRDEIGQLAAAFNTVNEVTVRVAHEQAALRASIAEMFVNVARRNQVLLGRQLSQIDQMEHREEDPDVLQSLFRLDHLATRMRRNAESLLVLAGIDSTRRLRRPLPLSDVIRTAIGEIEAFDRVDLSIGDDTAVTGRHSLTIAHLLAEVLENATHFSNPGTRVVVATARTESGVDVTVTDYGLGMSPAELADANEKIAHPPVAEIAVSQRLGLFVVGRLAARLGTTVGLRRGRAAGTVVTIHLPVSVFEGLSVTDLVSPTELPASPPAFGDPVAEAAQYVAAAVVAVEPPDAVAEPAALVEPVMIEPVALVEPVLVEPVLVIEPEPPTAGQSEAERSEPAPTESRRRGLLPRRGRRPVEPVEDVPPVEAEAVPETAEDVPPQPAVEAVEVVDVEPAVEVVDVEPVAEVAPVVEVFEVFEPVVVDEASDGLVVNLLPFPILPEVAEPVVVVFAPVVEVFAPVADAEPVYLADLPALPEMFVEDPPFVDEAPFVEAAPVADPAPEPLVEAESVVEDVPVVEAEPVEDLPVVDPVADEAPQRGRIFGLRRRGPSHRATESAEPVPQPADPAEQPALPVRPARHGAAAVVEPVVDAEPVVDVEPAAPAFAAEPPAHVVEPVVVPVVEPPAPVVPRSYAAAIDILPSRPARGRRRAPVVRPEPVAAAPAPQPAPAAAPAPVTPAPVTPAPVVESPFADILFTPAPFTPSARVPTQHAPEFPVPPVPAVVPVPQPSYALAGDAPARPSFPTLSDADLAAGALSELRGLYEPSFTSQPAPVPVGGLTRRTRRAETEIEPVEDTPAVPRRTRNPAEVRGMLSGFRAGVERGRTAPYDLGDGTDAPDSTS